MKEILLNIFLMVAAVYDWKSGKIPNILTVGGWLTAILCDVVSGASWWYSVILSLCIAFPFFFFFRVRLVGGGDVKLIAMLGAYVGFSKGCVILLYSFLMAGIVGVCLHGFSKKFWRQLQEALSYLLNCVRGGKKYSVSEQFDPICIPYAPFLWAAHVLFLIEK